MSRIGTCTDCGGTLYDFGNRSGNCLTTGCPNEVYQEDLAEWEEEVNFRAEEWNEMIIADRMERSLQLFPIYTDHARTVWTSG